MDGANRGRREAELYLYCYWALSYENEEGAVLIIQEQCEINFHVFSRLHLQSSPSSRELEKGSFCASILCASCYNEMVRSARLIVSFEITQLQNALMQRSIILCI